MYMVGRLYLEHLTDGDLALLAGLQAPGDRPAADPDSIPTRLGSQALFQRLIRTPGRDPLLQGSPFLLFSVLVHRVVQDLERASFVEEWVGPGQRVPVFAVTGLREFGADPMRRLFLSELLASYTQVASGSLMVRTRRGWRRRRFSELDPLRMVELAQVAPPAERPAVYRRLGDLSLFLSGIFPDYAAERLITERERGRLERALPVPAGPWPEFRDGVALLESLGTTAYRMAQPSANRQGIRAGVLAEVAGNFATARRLLNILTDRYLFPLRQQWFGGDDRGQLG
jgi:hypothetical protein